MPSDSLPTAADYAEVGRQLNRAINDFRLSLLLHRRIDVSQLPERWEPPKGGGRLPTPNELDEYEAICPGAREAIERAAVAAMVERLKQEKRSGWTTRLRRLFKLSTALHS